MSRRSKKIRKFLAIILTALSFLFAGISHAQTGLQPQPPGSSEETLLLQEIPSVYSASKYEQKVTEAPSSVTIITSDEIKKYGYRTLADILRSVRSFYVTYDRNYNYLGVRGFARPGDYNTRVLFLIDGHRLNDNVYDQAPIGTHFILDVDLIDRVEIIRGPSSSLYGPNAFFGVINVITKRGRDLKGIEVSGEAGSLETYKGRGSFGKRFTSDIETLLSGTVFDSAGQKDLFFKEFDDPSTNNGIVVNSDNDHFYNLFAKQSFHDFVLEGAYVSRTKSIPTASYGTVFNDPRTHTQDSQGFLDLKYDRTFDNQLGVMARLFYDQYYYKGDYAYNWAGPVDPPNIIMNKDYAKGEWWGAEVQLRKRLFEKHDVIWGAEYQDNLRQNQGNYDVEVYLDDKRHSQRWGLYIQDEFRIHDKVTFSAGVRYDYYETFGGTTNPRIGLIYHPLEKTYLKLLYGTAFRAPNAYESYYMDFGITKANPDLKPEKIATYELVLEQYIGNHLRASVDGFYYRINNLINQQRDPEDGLLVFTNTDKVEAKGVEFELEGKWPSGFEGRLSYSIQNAKNDATGETLTNSPAQLVKLNLIAPLVREKLFAGLEVQYTSKRKTLAGNYVDGFYVTNLTLFSQRLAKGLEISGSVYNLFNKKYGDPGAEEHVQDILQQDGRTFRVKVTYLFDF